jgi:hypothetical protein
MVTVDPSTTQGRRGYAWHLVRDRLAGGRWPLFDNTPNKALIQAGAPLAFYVGGTDKHAGTIVALASVGQKVNWSAGRTRIDPARYDTEAPTQALVLAGLKYLHPPVSFKDALPKLTICPSNMQRWGVVLMGGVRGISEADWRTLFDGVALGDELYGAKIEPGSVVVAK